MPWPVASSNASRQPRNRSACRRPSAPLNVQGAFRVPTECKAEVAGRRLILIDDVLTSGATSDACARALLRAGARSVDCWCSPGLSTRCEPPYKLPSETRKTIMAPVEIYTTPYCPYCLDAKALLKKKNVAFTEFDVSRDRDLRVKMIERANGRTTVRRFSSARPMSAAATISMSSRAKASSIRC